MKDIAEMVDDYIEETGLARIEFRPTDGVGVVFLDENEFIPLWDLAYNQELGFFRVSVFPDQKKEGGYIEPAPTKYYLARIKTFDVEEEYFNYAIVPDDGLRPFLLGEKPSVEALLQTITRFVEAGDVDFDLDEADYDDLQTWLDIEKAGQQFGVGVETLRKAAQRGAEGEKSGIPGAQKDGHRWIVPLSGLKQWLKNRPKRGPAGKEMTKEKEKPIGVCDFCGGPIKPDEWYTSKGRPRLHCSIDCRQTDNSRRGSPVRAKKAKVRVARGEWQNPAKLNPPTPEEQGRRAKLGREREVEAGTWRNPALDDAAREKLSRPRVHNDPVLHAAMEKLRHSPMSALTPEEKEAYRLYRLDLKPDRETANDYSRRRYHARQAALTPEERQAQREKYKQDNHMKEARRAGKPLISVTYTNPGRVQLWTPTTERVTAVDLGYVLRLKRESWTIGPSAAGPWSEETFSTRGKAVSRLRELHNG